MVFLLAHPFQDQDCMRKNVSFQRWVRQPNLPRYAYTPPILVAFAKFSQLFTFFVIFDLLISRSWKGR